MIVAFFENRNEDEFFGYKIIYNENERENKKSFLYNRNEFKPKKTAFLAVFFGLNRG